MSRVTAALPLSFSSTQHLASSYDGEARALHLTMLHGERPCFTQELVRDIVAQQNLLAAVPGLVDFVVLRSSSQEYFNLGGDLARFVTLIESGDRRGLYSYALDCIRGVYGFSTSHRHGAISIAAIAGGALGGGFEVALSCNLVVAERTAKLGFPELLFGLFPGMGALSFVSRRASVGTCASLVSTARTLSGEEAFGLGLVDVLAPPGELDAVVTQVMRRRRPALRGYRSFLLACERSGSAVEYEELRAVVEVWVDAACALGARELKVMKRLIRAQDRLLEEGEGGFAGGAC